jgi:hypothetical protein
VDVELFLQGVIRFSNFMTSRLLVSGVVFYIASGFVPLGNATDGFLPSIDLVNGVVQNYQNIFDTLGVSDFAILLILFVFITTIHLIYVAFNAIGRYLPPAILPISGWVAVERVTAKPFETLRLARGQETSEEENQRLYEFKQRLRAMELASREKFRERLEGPLRVISRLKSLCARLAAAVDLRLDFRRIYAFARDAARHLWPVTVDRCPHGLFAAAHQPRAHFQAAAQPCCGDRRICRHLD